MKQLITIPLAARTIDATVYVYRDAEAPGIIFLHDLMGAVPVVHEAAKAIAEEGYHVLVPDLYSGGITQAKYCTSHIFSKAMLFNEVQHNDHMEEIHRIIDFFKTFRNVKGNGLGIVGQCLTGGFILHAAIREEVKAPVVFHHSFGITGSGIPEESASQIQNTIQGHYSNFDPLCPKARVDKLQQQLGNKLVRYQYWLPHGIPHLFLKNKQAETAFSRMIHHFKENL